MVSHMRRQEPAGSTQVRQRPMLTPQEAAERLNVTLRFIRRLCHERRVPYTKVGKFVRFDPDELEAWILAKRVMPRDGHTITAGRGNTS